MGAIKRAVSALAMHCEAGFDLEVIYGSTLRIRLEYLLAKFAPSGSLLPINVSFLSWLWWSNLYFAAQDKENGIVWFLQHQIAKELVWYLVFRSCRSGTVTPILSDLEPSAFRGAAHPPPATLALAASRVSCFYPHPHPFKAVLLH
jgi:hypothetical protein